MDLAISSQHQSVGEQVTSDPLEKGLTRNTARSWWIAVDTTKELEGCLKKLDRAVSRKSRNCATHHRAEVNNLELRNQIGRTWEKLLLGTFVIYMKLDGSCIGRANLRK